MISRKILIFYNVILKRNGILEYFYTKKINIKRIEKNKNRDFFKNSVLNKLT